MHNFDFNADHNEAGSARRAFIIALIIALFVLIRDILLLWAFSFGYYRDSTLYVNLGRTLFQKSGPFSDGLITFPYPFINAITLSSINPLQLIWVQILIGAFAAGALIYIIAKKRPLLAVVMGSFFVFDFVWGAVNRNVLKEGLFVSFNVLCLAILLSHYDRRKTVSKWELLLAGLFYGWVFIFRPSSLYLTILIVPLYLWLTRSWHKTGFLLIGFVIIYLALGLFNLWSSGEFRVLGRSGYYTGSPLFIYRLYSPENGPASLELNEKLSACMPDMDYANAMDTSAGGVKNNEILYGQFFSCLRSYDMDLDQISDLFTRAYIEGILSNPGYYTCALYREGVTFIKYNVPYILRFYLKPEKNNRCDDYPWCQNIRDSRFSWSSKIPFKSQYLKIATKTFQLYLLPIRPINIIFPNNPYLPYAISWVFFILFLLLATRGSIRFLVISTLLLFHYVIVTVISGYGFLERYASVLTPFYIILSSVALVTLGRLIWDFSTRLRNRNYNFRSNNT